MVEKIELSVRELVEFLMRSGSIDNRFGGFDRAQEGARIHRKLQKEAPAGYEAEVTLSETTDRKGFVFHIRGRADGIIKALSEVVIDEIKTTTRDISEMEEDEQPVHWAQAKCYGFMYGKQNGLEFITIQLTYYQMETQEIRRFRKQFSVIALEAFYMKLLDDYIGWAEMEKRWRAKRNTSIANLRFPYTQYRKGQREMALAVYNSIRKKSRLFCQAPTGIGKTLSTVFPAIKAQGSGIGDKIFYLTAKTITRRAAADAVALLRDEGVFLRSVVLTAKDKICFLEERRCNPEDCPYAKGYFDRINDVLAVVLEAESDYTRERIEILAREHTLCPFELSLDLALFCDLIICDYNYLFDPVASLRRFFMENDGPWVFLVDEAHNLVDRAREMYSAGIAKSGFLEVKRLLDPKKDKRLFEPVKKVDRCFIDIRKSEANKNFWTMEKVPESLNENLTYFCFACENWMKKNPTHESAEKILALYFDARAWLRVAEVYDQHYVTQVTLYGSEVRVKQLCLDPATQLSAMMAMGRSTVLFSATLTPIEYFVDVLGGSTETPRYCLPSPFDARRLGILLADNISTRYRGREESYEPIARIIHRFISAQPGNYLVYFPSYAYLDAVVSVFTEKYPEVNRLVQSREMDEPAREAFLEAFCQKSDTPCIGFCVMGGIYAEGIDLKGDALIGSVIVGVGLPQIGEERNTIRDYYTKERGNGFAYAYQYPGMNKVLQAIGRVIRDEKDKGMVLLIDDRFAASEYRALFPEHLKHYTRVHTPEAIETAVKAFWKNEAML